MDATTTSVKISPTLANRRSHTARKFHAPIFILSLLAAGAHLYLAAQPDEDLRFFFLLNGLGYIGLATLFILPKLISLHALIRWVLFGYAVLTIILWFFLGSPSEGKLDPFDAVVKADEIVLVVLLFLDSKEERQRA